MAQHPAMAFLTGVDLEGRLRQEQHDESQPLLALPAPPRRKVHPEIPSILQIQNEPYVEPPRVGHLMNDCSALDDRDAIDDLRRMIQRTRKKMDNQKAVMRGFLHDVNQIRMMDQNFRADELTPRGPAALADKPGPSPATIKDRQPPAAIRDSSSSPAAIKDCTAPAAITGGPGPPRALGPPAPPEGPPPVTSSTGRLPAIGCRTAGHLGRGSSTSPSGVARSKSQPSLRPVPSFNELDTSYLKMPARRAPPGSVAREVSVPMQRSQGSLKARNEVQQFIRRKPPLLSGVGRSGGAAGLLALP